MVGILVSVLLLPIYELPANPTSQTATDRKVSETYNRLMQTLFSPALTSQAEVLQWAMDYDEVMGRIVDLDTTLTDEDLNRIRRMRDFIPVFLAGGQHQITSRLYMVFSKDVGNVEQLLTTMTSAYQDIAALFHRELDLSPPQGFLFVLVVKEREQIGDEDIAGFVFKASRFIVMPLAYYSQGGLRIPDFGQFHGNFKHELVHAFINSIAGYERAVVLPQWFHEMTAISLGGDKKFSTRGESLMKLSELYQEFYDAARHLIKQKGRAKYHEYVKQSILSGDPLQTLSQIYGYDSYEDLRWDSMDAIEKASAKIGRAFATVKNRLKQTSAAEWLIVMLMLAFPLGLIYSIIAGRRAIRRPLQEEFSNAERLGESGVERKSLVTFRSFLKNLDSAYERRGKLFIGLGTHLEQAKASIGKLQRKILDGGLQAIAESAHDTFQAEELIFALENDKGSLLDGSFALEAKAFLDKNASAMINKAWRARNKSYADLCRNQRYLEALESCLHYAVTHEASDYYPESKVSSQLKIIADSYSEAYNSAGVMFKSCEEAIRIKEIVERLKLKNRRSKINSIVAEIINEVECYCILDIIGKIILNGQRERFMEAHRVLVEILKRNYAKTALKTKALTCAYDMVTTVERESAYLATDLLMGLLKIVEAKDDPEEASRIHLWLERLSFPS
jgi:hypothetical protein